MKPEFLFAVCLAAVSAQALRIPFIQARSNIMPLPVRRDRTESVQLAARDPSPGGEFDLRSVYDLIYLTNVTVGGNNYVVQFDTGSSDLWIKGQSFPLPNVSHTNAALNLSYGIGWVYGNVSTADIEFGGYNIPQQALLDVSAANNPALQYNAQGVLGLSFTSFSMIDQQVNKSGGTWGHSLAFALFESNPSVSKYVTFSMQRTTQNSSGVPGLYTIGEIAKEFPAISTSVMVPTFPPDSPTRWSVLLDAILIGTPGSQKTLNVSSSVPGASSDSAVATLDTGTSYSYCSPEIAQAIYGSVPGASLDEKVGVWTLPCDAEIDIALQFGGSVYPVHPLDVNMKSASANSCTGTFVPQSISTNKNEFDLLLGDSFLRSVYVMFNFGEHDSNDNRVAPYVKMLSLVDPNKASSEFVAARGGTARSDITYNAASGSTSASTTLALSSSTAQKIAQLVDYIPVVFGLMGLNALALLLVAIVGIVFLCRRRKRKGSKKGSGGSYPLDMRANREHNGGSAAAGATSVQLAKNTNTQGEDEYEGGYQYARVKAVADLDDIPFTPPTPSFHDYGADTVQPLPSGSRVAFPRDYRVSAAGSDVTAFVPPSPGFKKFMDSSRPTSVA